MAEYNVKVKLEANGKTFENFNTFVDSSETKAIQVELMNTTGSALMTPRPGFTVTVLKQNIPDDIDLEDIQNGIFTANYLNGERITYGGVYTAETGDGTSNGTDPFSRTITFIAETKTKE